VRVLLDVSAVPARPVGAGVYTTALAAGLATRSEVELHLATRRDDANRWAAIAPGAELHAVVPPRRPLRLLWERTRGAALARRLGVDVWHGPHYTMPTGLGCAAVVTVHDMTFFDHPEWHERVKVAYFRRMIATAARHADVLVCDSEFTAARLRALVTPHGEVRVVPLGVDAARFAPDLASSTADLARLAGRGIEPPYLAFAGTFEPRKNIPTLIGAFALLTPTHPELRLVLAGGDGWGTNDVRAAIATSGAGTRIVRPGYVDDDTLAALFRRAEAVVYPSFEEGFGLPALEALASGTPLVTSEGSALQEVAGDAAVLAPPTDTAAIAAAIARVVDDTALADHLRHAGPKRAAEFTWARCVDSCVEAYAHAVRERISA
jgi:glycosyltransferase involved in cell wall biosynthesis